jgi:hypothetical protein
MTEQPLPAKAALAVSPSLSLRQAVRPLIFAHALLASERPLAGQLAEECERLSRLTREALEAAAMVHLLGPDRSDTGASSDAQDHRAELIAAYAKAAMRWAEVVGTAVALGDALLDSERVDDARRLADFLDATGEPTAGKDLRRRADAATRRALEPRLARIHAAMPESEIASAVETLRESGDEATVAFFIRSVAESMANTLPEEEYTVTFAESGILGRWYVSPGDLASTGTNVFIYANQYTGLNWQMPYAARFSTLLLPTGAQVFGETAVASIIRLGDQILRELQSNAASTENSFARLDAIAWEFRQRMEEARTRANGA